MARGTDTGNNYGGRGLINAITCPPVVASFLAMADSGGAVPHGAAAAEGAAALEGGVDAKAEAEMAGGGGEAGKGGELAAKKEDGDEGEEEEQEGQIREQDRFLPIANISRIMKKALPANAKIAKDAKETVQECVSEFISFITSEASDKCQREKRKTINGDDLLWAMATLGFEDYVEPLKVYLTKYREVEGEKANQTKAGEQ